MPDSFQLTRGDDLQIDFLIQHTEPEGDYVFNGEDSIWEADVNQTLITAARRVKRYIELRREGKTEAEASQLNG